MRIVFLGISSGLVACLLAFVPVACTSGKKSDRAKEIELSEQDRKKFDELQNEMEVGRNMAGRLLSYYGRYDSDDLTAYVNQVGNYVASNGDFPDRRYMFDIIESDQVNAFACPGGYILVTLGAVRHARNEAELAMVLGHEVAHVGKKHMYTTLKSMSAEDIEKAAAESEKRSNLPEEVRNRERPKPEQSAAGALAARYLSGSTGGLNVLAASKAGMSLILEKGLGAHLETEADHEGVRYAVRAGYDPKALNDYLCRLEDKSHEAGKRCKLEAKAKKKSGGSILDKTHPPVAERVQSITKVLASLRAKEIVGATGEERFAGYTKNLPPPKTKTKSH